MSSARIRFAVAAPLRPAQLPAPVGYFTGRAMEMHALDDVVQRDGGTPLVAVICGHGGIGKTSLAVQWAHRVAHRFPDGQLFVDVRGAGPETALTPLEVAGVLLRCLGVPEDRLPDGLDERAGLYRSLLAGKRMLIVLDNVGATEQVGPLVPGSAASLLLVTSRSNLAALVTHVEVRQIVLEVLSEGEAADLFAKVLGEQRVGREPEAVSRLAALCCLVPLALRIAAAKLARQPNRAIGALADEVSGDDRLAHLRVEGETRTVEAVFATAYRALSEPCARALPSARPASRSAHRRTARRGDLRFIHCGQRVGARRTRCGAPDFRAAAGQVQVPRPDPAVRPGVRAK